MTVPARPALLRSLGRWTLAALVVNGIIGSGIFSLPSTIAGKVGSDALWVYLLAALGISVIVATFAELSSQFREAGGPYLYAREALGRLAGIQTGWFLWLMRLASAAATANIFVVYLGEFWPAATAPFARAAILAALIGSLALVNIRGVSTGAGFSNFFTAAKLLPLFAFIIAGLLLVKQHVPAVSVAPTAGNWTEAVVVLLFGFGGFEAALIPAGETKDPRRDMPFALFTGFALVTVIYLLAHLVTMWTVPDLAHSERPLADAARAFAGPTGAVLISLGALFSTCGWLAAQLLSAPRLTYALAERGDFPRVFAAVHPRYRTPYVSIILWAVLAYGLSVYGNFIWNAVLSVGARLVTYIAGCAALIQLRRTRPMANAWRAPAGNFLAVLGIALGVLMGSRLGVTQITILGGVALIALVNWLAVRKRPGGINGSAT